MGLWNKIKKGVGGVVKNYTGIDLNKGPADTLFGKAKTAQVADKSNYQYGGSEDYQNAERARLSGAAAGAQNRGAYQVDRSAIDGAMATGQNAINRQNASFADEKMARMRQNEAATMFRDAAQGKGESVAAAQQRAGLEDASRQAQNQAANAVGVNPLLATANATSASQDAARRSVAGAAALRAQEIAEARQGYAGIAGDMRAGDIARGQAALQGGQFGLSMGQLGFEGAQAQAGLEMQQRGLNDQQQLAYEQYLQRLNEGTLQGNIAYGNALTGTSTSNASNSVAVRGQNQDFTNRAIDSAGKFVGAKGGAG
jgi:hypothetical protein